MAFESPLAIAAQSYLSGPAEVSIAATTEGWMISG